MDIADDRHGRILAELAGLSLELARDLQARALAAESDLEAARLAAAFQGVARGLRQTLALELKVADFRREQEVRTRQARAAGVLADLPDDPAILRAALARDDRRAEIDAVVGALIWTEYERAENDEERTTPRPHPNAAALQRTLDHVLDVAERRADFATADLHEQIAVACMALGLDPGLIRERVEPQPEPADTG